MTLFRLLFFYNKAVYFLLSLMGHGNLNCFIPGDESPGYCLFVPLEPFEETYTKSLVYCLALLWFN